MHNSLLGQKVTPNIQTSKVIYQGASGLAIPPLSGYALAYGGTQFGSYNELGDGRSAVIKKGSPYVIVKGGFTTCFTPLDYDGTYTRRSALKEARIGEFLYQQRVPTQRTQIIWEQEKGVSAVLCRTLPYRIGTLEHLRRRCPEAVLEVWQEVADRLGADSAEETLDYIVLGYKDLNQQWSELGFVHGCLNTDNMGLYPEGIDYGHSYFVRTNSRRQRQKRTFMDIQGRYSYDTQPCAIAFGLYCLWKALALEGYPLNRLKDLWY